MYIHVVILGGAFLVFISILLTLTWSWMAYRLHCWVAGSQPRFLQAQRYYAICDNTLMAARVFFWIGLALILGGFMVLLVP